MIHGVVSVIIPVYNTAKYLDECINSVVEQTYKQLEIIIIDDGSTDNSPEIIRKYAELDSRIKPITQSNKGQGAARNVGLAVASGSTIMFLDADDYFSPDLVKTVCYELGKTKSEIVIFNGIAFWDDGKNISNDKTKYFSLESKDAGTVFSGIDFLISTKGRITQPCMKVYCKEFIDKHGICFPDGGHGEDTCFFYETFIMAQRVCYIDYIGYHRRYRSDSTMTTMGSKNIESRISHFPWLLALLDKVSDANDKRKIVKQYVYYACLLWIMINNCYDKEKRTWLEARYAEFRLERVIIDNRSDLVTIIFSFFVMLPKSMSGVKVIIAKIAKQLLKGKTRFFI